MPPCRWRRRFCSGRAPKRPLNPNLTPLTAIRPRYQDRPPQAPVRQSFRYRLRYSPTLPSPTP
ncbi:hypothetical protein BN874_510010 [Candidatus Contendobacter odensis Run_B_J11]|uniref:Uncharacterized protein n=1 Tax=Candidatus Contendobacter odensis Run_B_J11 TaxID=1400861 RepID=A0A7U7GE19_9GAMM|nr:hypothetical protein BN874_510010 [Candidatus Contendobacter odensis Run_B_J11]